MIPFCRSMLMQVTASAVLPLPVSERNLQTANRTCRGAYVYVSRFYLLPLGFRHRTGCTLKLARCAAEPSIWQCNIDGSDPCAGTRVVIHRVACMHLQRKTLRPSSRKVRRTASHLPVGTGHAGGVVRRCADSACCVGSVPMTIHSTGESSSEQHIHLAAELGVARVNARVGDTNRDRRITWGISSGRSKIQ